VSRIARETSPKNWLLEIKLEVRLMMDANYISERLGSMRQEISDLRITTARYWSKGEHTALEKSAFALRKGRLLEIKREVSDMLKRCA
jgi:hypothetical protein